jgi:outer membrane lipoprotein carrier protein
MSKRFLALAALALVTSAATFAQTPSKSPPATALDAYLNGLKTLRAEFAQIVTDGKGSKVQEARGVFVIQRPGKFRWELKPEGATSPQLMIADGANLWFYDQDLDQVTVKPAVEALSATPASLLSGDGDLAKFFRVVPDGKSDGFTWVRVTPLRSDADFREVRIGFKGFGTELERMVLKDKLGQTVSIDFLTSARNGAVEPAEVSFAPPPGADVIGTLAP